MSSNSLQLDDRSWFDLDYGVVFSPKEPMKHFIIEESLFEMDSLLTLMRMENIAPTPVHPKTTKLFLNLLTKILKVNFESPFAASCYIFVTECFKINVLQNCTEPFLRKIFLI